MPAESSQLPQRSLHRAETSARDLVREPRRPPGWYGTRAAFDGLACLALAVLILRTFLVEGYMISTGSMAPALYGYHKRVVCPTCHEQFALGVAFDGSATLADELSQSTHNAMMAVCPNCGQNSIDVSRVPRNHGDQLLVLKQAFEFQPPSRWEVAVFRNPGHPTQAFVKRIVGLPGENIQVIDGDVYADGQICRKSLQTQRSMRIPVFDAEHVPHQDPDWRPRWTLGPGWLADGQAKEFRYSPISAPQTRIADVGELAWLSYRHCVRSESSHESAIRLENLPLGFELPESPFVEPVRFENDPETPAAGTLTVQGTLSSEWEATLRDLSAKPAYQAAIDDLARLSRSTPITDAYGYNRTAITANPVHDLMLACSVRLSGEGQFAIEMTDGTNSFRLIINSAARELSLIDVENGDLLRSSPMPPSLRDDNEFGLEMSVMDRQVIVAIDGLEPFAAWTYDNRIGGKAAGLSNVRLGALGLEAQVRSLILYRDVYYTRGKGHNGIRKPYQLGSKEYFVLGDNSPVSLDSRSWADGAVPAHLLLGKPFIVHLPSRPATLRLGTRELTVRIPDFNRIRYIH